ncbi:TPA: beta strand repeat-containing protein, partial [Haemophilus influenzae]
LAEIVNHGLITVGKDGSVNLIGGKVKNEGVISVNGGSISLLAGQKITISDIINPTITYSIAAPENEAINLGDIFAKGGNINVRAANIRNKGKLSADSVSKDKSGNIVLSAKEGEAEIGGVISAQNQQAKGGKLMITGDKVTLKTGAVIDLSGKEGGETYLGGDERGEGKNGIQLAKKTSLEKGSTINVSGKEKGGRAIVWGDIALIDGNINAQGKDIAKTGGFVETSGHYLSIGNNAVAKTKEWLLDPENVIIENESVSRTDNGADVEFPKGRGTASDPKKNNTSKTILTNATISQLLTSAQTVNITASKNLTVNSSINIGNNSHLILHSEGKSGGGVKIKEDITSNGGNLTIQSGGWVDVHKNITLGTGYLNITSKNSVAFEKDGRNKERQASEATITAQGTINITGENTEFRLNNVSLNGTDKGINIISRAGNHTHKLTGEINITGNVTINQTSNDKFYKVSHDSFWNVSALNLAENANFTFIKYAQSNSSGTGNDRRSFAGVIFNGLDNNMSFNIAQGANVRFKLKPNERTDKNVLPIRFKANITATNKGSVLFDIYANLWGKGASLEMDTINISGGSKFAIKSHVRNHNAFEINKDLTINATGSNFTLEQSADQYNNMYPKKAINSTHNLTILGGNVTLGGQNSSSSISGNVTINNGASVTLKAYNDAGNASAGPKNITLGNLSVGGELSLVGASANINGNLSVKENAKFKGETQDNLNITGTFINNGDSKINISQGVVKLGNVTNDGSLNITTHAKGNQKSIIRGDIINKKGSLNITNNGRDTEIQIGGNISQKEGNLTISSDKINITQQITIKKGIDGESSVPDVTANLTIKTKKLELTKDLNISGFNKAEIVAKDNSDLIIGNTGSTDAKKVSFNQVKDSKISAGSHNVTLNSKVETSNGNNDAESNNGDSTSLTINAKNVTVNNNINSHKTVNITASENVTTKAGTTINATTGSVEVTAKTGDIKGGIESTSGSVTLTATGATLAVGNISGNTVTITADSGKLTSTAGSTINGTNSVTTSSQSGDIEGTISGNTVSVKATSDLITQSGSKIEAKTGEANVTSATGTIGGTISGNAVNVIANTGSLTVEGAAKIEATRGAATLTATKGTLTTAADSSISAASGTLAINAKDAKLNGAASGNHTVVNATNASGSGSVTAKTSSSVNITGDLNTINGLNIISENGRNTVRLRGKEI